MEKLIWRKSRHSSDQGGNCIEVAKLTRGRAVRDSKNTSGPALTFPPATWGAFIAGVRAGQFD